MSNAFLQCTNLSGHADGKVFWHVWTPEESAVHALSSGLSQIPARTPSLSPPPNATVAPVQIAGRCAKVPCPKVRVHTLCSRRMCKPHCVASGPGCVLKSHQTDKISMPLQISPSMFPSAAASSSASAYPCAPPASQPIQEYMRAPVEPSKPHSSTNMLLR